ncbi:MAG: ATPase [Methanoculleus sp. SDB]|nr:MAG: ATPase [Methanoculleus sp. SDB]
MSTPLHTLPVDEALAHLKTRPAGLTPEEAAERLKTAGFNELETKIRKNYLRVYVRQYVQFFALLLEIAAVLSFVAHSYAPGEGYDLLGYAILGAVVINASFAFWQEYKADKTLEALTRLIPKLVQVRRDASTVKIPARTVVPGDILVLEEGDRIPADGILIETNSLYLNNATLTGESRPVNRREGPATIDDGLTELKNVVFAGTTVVSGNGVAAVYATGKTTEFGKIAIQAKEVKKPPTPMQQEIIRITRILTAAALLVGAVFFVLGFVSGRGFFISAIFALSLIVANVPEGMLPTITLSLSLASQHMARRNALIKNLDSVQTLGSATVICSDKTGTITRNEMTLKELYLAGGEVVSVSGEGYFQNGDFQAANPGASYQKRLHFFLRAGLLNCRAAIDGQSAIGDPTELALVAAARKGGVDTGGYAKVKEFPFTSERKMMSTVADHPEGRRLFSKGAVEVLLPLCVSYVAEGEKLLPMDQAERDRITARAEAFERAAYRVLAVAYRDGDCESDLVLLGLVAIMDLPRAEVSDAIARCYQAGIRVMVLTGDNPLTAEAVARHIGLRVDTVITGDRLRRCSDDDLRELLREKDVLFARMRSDQKLRIATILQENGEVVAMTGDGVNDAPALKKADIGISMGGKGTEVAKEASDMILLDDNFASIVAAIEEGRTVYFNIKKFVTYILSSNVPEIVPYILQFFLRIPLPLSVIQILTIDLGSDMLPGLALGNERPEQDVMLRPPVGKNERILDREVFKRGYFFLGMIEAAAAMAAFLGFLLLSGWQYGDLSITGTDLHRQAMTMTLLGAVVCQLANVWTLRSWEFSAFSRGLFSNRLLIGAICIEIIWIWALLSLAPVQAVFNTASVPPVFLLLLLPFPVLLFAAHEIYKYRLRRNAAA